MPWSAGEHRPGPCRVLSNILPWHTGLACSAQRADALVAFFAQPSVRPRQVAHFFGMVLHVAFAAYEGHIKPFPRKHHSILEELLGFGDHHVQHLVINLWMRLVHKVRYAEEKVASQVRVPLHCRRSLCSHNTFRLLCSRPVAVGDGRTVFRNDRSTVTRSLLSIVFVASQCTPLFPIS